MQTSGLGFKRTFGVGNKPIWQRDKGMLLYQGGFALVKGTLAEGFVIPAGNPGVADEALRTFTPLSVGSLQASATNTAVTYRINKGSALKVGDNLAAAPGGAAYPITAIDTSNAAYDTVTVGTTLGVVLAAGAFVFASTATGATAAAFPAINGLLYEEEEIVSGISQAVSVVIRGTVYARRIPYSAGLAALSGLDEITFSQSY